MSAPDLKAIFRAGFVRRWHTNPDLAHTVDRIDGHSARVARIIMALHPSPPLELIRAALIHDDGESVIGDIPGPAKERMTDSGWSLAPIEGAALHEVWGAFEKPRQDERIWLWFADRLDAYMWAAHHAPHVLNGDGWPEARRELMEAVSRLDPVGLMRRKLDLMLCEMEVAL
ncbi:hypothetical protein [Mameliella alba]|uniref:hypothetical protein n=1 Tax=Mameliella alba TaxID=561184 RepID=UPI0013FE334D|nr:hypothetical protein [Mameliella alba]